MTAPNYSQSEREFRKINKVIAGTADRIAAEVKVLLTRLPLDRVARDYVIEQLGVEIIRRNPELLDWLNGIGSQRGDASMRLAEALADWRDDWAGR